MIKNYLQYINEDLRSKKIIAPKEFTIDNLKNENRGLNITVTDFNVVISYDKELRLNTGFYEALKKDNIEPKDVIFENCEKILLYNSHGFTKISDYGVFGENIKDFNCAYCEKLTNLEGAPEIVGGNFNCSDCTNLTSLEGAPNKVDGNFSCEGCTSLLSLEFAPKEVGDAFHCSYCRNLTSLEGAPEKVGYFHCYGCDPDFIELAIAKYGDKVYK